MLSILLQVALLIYFSFVFHFASMHYFSRKRCSLVVDI